jgi:hypothetical protein
MLLQSSIYKKNKQGENEVSRTMKDWKKKEERDTTSKKPRMEPYKRDNVNLNAASLTASDEDEDFEMFPDDEEEEDESDIDSSNQRSDKV